MHDSRIEERLRAVLRDEGDSLPLRIDAIELERRLAVRRRQRTGRGRMLMAAVLATVAVGAIAAMTNGWLRLPGVGVGPSPSASESAGPSTAPSPTASPDASAPSAAATPLANPIEATIEQDGIALTLVLDHDRLRAGDPLPFVVRVVNNGPGIAFWLGPYCGTGVRVDGPPEPTERPGRSWDGDAGALKNISLPSDHPPMAATLTLDTWQRGYREQSCDSIAPQVIEMPEGGKLEVPGVWPATTWFGAPVPGGEYRATVSFGFLGRPPAGPFLEGTGPEDVTPIDVTVPLVVVPAEGPRLSPAEAMDAVLADSIFASWLTSLSRERWDGSDLRYENGQWVFVLRFDTGAGRVEVRVDAASGIVVDRTLP